MFNFLLPCCERCHKKLGPTHDVKECARATRGINRRYFFGAIAGGVALTTAASLIEKVPLIAEPRYLYRIPLIQYRGGSFGKYDTDDLSIGRGSEMHISCKVVEERDLSEADRKVAIPIFPSELRGNPKLGILA